VRDPSVHVDNRWLSSICCEHVHSMQWSLESHNISLQVRTIICAPDRQSHTKPCTKFEVSSSSSSFGDIDATIVDM